MSTPVLRGRFPIRADEDQPNERTRIIEEAKRFALNNPQEKDEIVAFITENGEYGSLFRWAMEEEAREEGVEIDIIWSSNEDEDVKRARKEWRKRSPWYEHT